MHVLFYQWFNHKIIEFIVKKKGLKLTALVTS